LFDTEVRRGFHRQRRKSGTCLGSWQFRPLVKTMRERCASEDIAEARTA
jgi:hypothetical protein